MCTLILFTYWCKLLSKKCKTFLVKRLVERLSVKKSKKLVNTRTASLEQHEKGFKQTTFPIPRKVLLDIPSMKVSY